MTTVRTQQFQTYPPRTVARTTFRSLIASLDSFMPGLPTASRQIKARAISHGRITDLEGSDSWKVTDSHPLSELEHLQVEILLISSTNESCELHIELRQNHIALSVSDIQTGWGKAVFEEGRHLLQTLGLSPHAWQASVIRGYQVLEIMQMLLLAFATAVFSLWLKYESISYAYGAIGLMLSGSTPTIHKIVRFLRPPKKTPILQESATAARSFPWVEASAILGFVGAAMSLAKELISAIATK